MSSNRTISAVIDLHGSIVPFITENFRNKRQLWEGYDYNNYYGYGFHWGRLIFIILFLIALFLCCLVPCICALGIWFAGWFGLRNTAAYKRNNCCPAAANAYTKQQPAVAQQTMIPQNTKSARPENSRECMDSYVYEERNEEKRRDRYYHRPPSPRPHDYKRPFTSSKL